MKSLWNLCRQFLRFGIIGVLCFGIDYGLMILLTEMADIEYIYSTAISYTISTVINYILSVRFVFCRRENADYKTELLVFLALGLIGLGFNQMIMWVVVEHYGIPYQLAKLLATATVGVYNFVSRKLLLE